MWHAPGAKYSWFKKPQQMPHYADFESVTTTSEPTPIKHAAKNWAQTRNQTLVTDFRIKTMKLACIWMHSFGVQAQGCLKETKKNGEINKSQPASGVAASPLPPSLRRPHSPAGSCSCPGGGSCGGKGKLRATAGRSAVTSPAQRQGDTGSLDGSDTVLSPRRFPRVSPKCHE